MYILYLVLSTIALITGYKLYNKFVNPISVFFLVWNLCFLLFQLNLIRYNQFELKSWIVIILVSFVYFLGCLIGWMLTLHKSSVKVEHEIQLNNNGIREDLKKIIIFFTLISTISIVPKLLRTIKIYGINLIASSNQVYGDSIRHLTDTDSAFNLESFIFIAIIFSGIYLYRYGLTWFIDGCILLTLCAQLSSGSRGALFVEICLLVGTIILSRKHNRRSISGDKAQDKVTHKSYIVLVILLIIFILIITFLRGQDTIALPYADDKLYHFGKYSQLIYSIDYYFTSPLATLNEFIKAPVHNLWGAATFRPFYLVFNQFGWVHYNVDFINEYLFYSPVPANVLSFIGELIFDFGYVGLIVVTFLLGLIFSASYSKYKVEYSITWNIIMVLCFTLTTLSFFAWFLRPAYLWITLIFGLAIGIFLDKKWLNQNTYRH